jgi:hypothetical protein
MWATVGENWHSFAAALVKVVIVHRYFSLCGGDWEFVAGRNRKALPSAKK